MDILKKYCIKDVISCKSRKPYILLDINFSNEDGFGWVEGEGMLPDLLPIYDEIKTGNHQFLHLVAEASNVKIDNSFEKSADLALSQAQEAFFKYAGIDHEMFRE